MRAHAFRRLTLTLSAAVATVVVAGGLAPAAGQSPTALARTAQAPAVVARDAAHPLDVDAILAAQHLDEPGWYRDNIPFLDTPDSRLDDVYYYRWSTYKRALRSTVPGTGYVSTEYDVPIGYSGNPYTALPDAAGYHLTDGRWAADQSFAGDYLDFYLKGAGVPGATNYSEWMIDAAYERALVTGDEAGLAQRLPDLIALYNRWSGRLDSNVVVNGQPSASSLYWQSPLSDATEFTETSMKSSDAFGGGAGYRPTINAYMYAAATAISKIATSAGQTSTASDFAARAAALKQGVQNSLWDPQRNFFFQVYNQQDGSNGTLKGTRTDWRELMGYAPWAFDLPDPQYSVAWKYLLKPQNFGAAFGPTTLERFQDFEAEQGTVVHANTFSSATASNGSYVGQIDFADSSVSFGVDAPGAGTYPVRIYYANGTGAPSTGRLFVGSSTTPITVTYPATTAWGRFGDDQYVSVDVPMVAGRNTIRLAKGDSFAEIDRIGTNPYFDYQAIPAQPNREDQGCCHWNGPSWPYQTSQVLTGMANLLQSYPAQPYVTADDYRSMLADFTTLQFKDGKPYVAEAADGDTGAWIYDAENFSENYNHSSYIDLVLTGLLGIKPQADDTLVLKPLVSPTWDHFAVQDLTYHGHQLSLVYDRDGTHYASGSGFKVFQDGTLVYFSDTVGDATIPLAPTVPAVVSQKLVNVAANPLAAEQDWLHRPITQRYPEAFASYTNQVSNGPHCHSGQTCQPTTFDQPLRATDGWIRYDRTPDDRWTNAGSPNTSDYLGVDFGAVRPIRQLSVYTYDDGGSIRTPTSLTAQYLAGGVWTDIPGQRLVSGALRGNDVNTVEFPTLTTSQVRVVLTPQPGAFVGVTELQSWYPQPPVARIISKNSGLELAASSGAQPYGAAVTQEATTGDLSHQWNVVPAENGFVKIINARSGFVLGIRNASTAVGQDGLLWVDNLTRDHLWSIVDAGNGYVKLVNANSGLVLGVDGASTAPGAKTVQWSDSGTDDHLWRVVAADTASAYAVTNQAASAELTVAEASTADGAAVVAGAPAGTTDRRWTLSPLADGTYHVTNQLTGKVLSATGTDPRVTQVTASDDPGTRWQVVGFGDGSQLVVNVVSNRALTVGSGAGDLPVTQEVITSAPSQRWQLTVDNAAMAPTPPTDHADVTTTSAAGPTADGWYGQSVRVTVSPPTGATAQYAIDGGPWTAAVKPFTLSRNGVHTVTTRLLRSGVVVDGSPRVTSVRVDLKAPGVSVTRTPGTGTPRNPLALTIVGTDADSGVDHTEVSVDGGAWRTATSPVTFDVVGTDDVQVRAVDRVGHVGAVRRQSVTIVPNVATTVTTSRTSVPRGGFVTVRVTGFYRWDGVRVSLGSTSLGTLTTDASGAGRWTVAVPGATPPGSSTLTVAGSHGTPVATVSLVVTAS